MSMKGKVLEVAVIAVKPGREDDFEVAFDMARKLPERVKGFRGLELRRGMERPDTYLLLAWWDTVDAHLRGFRESEHFEEWRALLGPFFHGTPQVFHYDAVIELG